MIRSTRRTRLPRLFSAALAVSLAVGATTVAASPAVAYEPVGVVHTEVVDVGPYSVLVGFSRWPLRAMQSLDITFVPEGGIADKQGTLTVSGAEEKNDLQGALLARHPRKLEVWGLDVISLDTAGTYAIDLRVEGPEGAATGSLQGLEVLPQPGPPLALSWAVCSIPFVGLVVLVAVGWGRARRVT